MEYDINDPIVVKVMDKIISRHEEGMEKFGITMGDNDKPLMYWIDDVIEELLDAVNYLTKLKTIVEEKNGKNNKKY